MAIRGLASHHGDSVNLARKDREIRRLRTALPEAVDYADPFENRIAKRSSAVGRHC